MKIPAFLVVIILFVAFIFPHNPVMATAPKDLSDCAGIESDGERLQCYDAMAGRQRQAPKDPLPGVLSAGRSKTPETKKSNKAKQIEEVDHQKTTRPSVMSRHWELDPHSREKAPVIRAHRPNYLLPAAYNSSLNKDPFLDVDRDAKAQNTEAKFQISFKVKLWEDVFDKNIDLWFAYTQLSFWQVYNSTFSSPFRETNYEPEVLLNFRTDYDFLGMKGRIINVGLNHQSNGRSSILSRSWNRVVANFGFERNDFNLLLKTWYRIPESEKDDDNSNISAYMGYGELWGTYYWKRHKFSAMIRNNLRIDNRGAAQIDWSFPIPFIDNDRISGYIQYFNGYGESLIDYNSNSNRVGMGIMLKDWD